MWLAPLGQNSSRVTFLWEQTGLLIFKMLRSRNICRFSNSHSWTETFLQTDRQQRSLDSFYHPKVAVVNIKVGSPSYFYTDWSIRAHTVMSQQEERCFCQRPFNSLELRGGRSRRAFFIVFGGECSSFNARIFFKVKKALSSEFVFLSFIGKMYVPFFKV